MSTDTQTAVRYERDADGIVTLTLDDPNQSANTMNELYISSMKAAVDRLYDEQADDDHRRRHRQREEDLLRRRRPQDHGADHQGRRRRGLRRSARRSRPRCAGSSSSPSRSSPPSTAPRSAVAWRSAWPANHRILVDDPSVKVGLPEASLGLLPGGGGVTRTVRMFGIQTALMDVLLQGTQFNPAKAKEKGIVDELVADPRGAGPGREGVDQGQPRGQPEPVGRPRLQDARWYPEEPGARRVPAGVPGAAAQADQGRRLPGRAGDPVGRDRGCATPTSTPPRGSSRATWPTWSSTRARRT